MAVEEAVTSPASHLRPLGAGELLDETIRLCRRHVRLFVGVGSAMLVPAVLQLVLTSARESGGLGAAVLGWMLYVLVSGLVYTAAYAAGTYAVSETYLGRDLTVGEAYARTLDRIGSMVVLWFVYLLALGFLTVSLVGIPVAMYLTLAWGFCFQTLLLERLGIGRALGRSRALVQGHWWRVGGVGSLLFLLGMFAYLFFFVPGLFLMGVAMGLGSAGGAFNVLGTLVIAAGQVLVQPLMLCGWVLLYYDLRVRKEGFDR
ncbi:MAG: EI24 domain-containing protein [Chloroflexi bacterium]|nr:EI24 domain-containing protein [Chloroflexota bacterium]